MLEENRQQYIFARQHMFHIFTMDKKEKAQKYKNSKLKKSNFCSLEYMSEKNRETNHISQENVCKNI